MERLNDQNLALQGGRDLLAGQLVYTVYEITVTTIDTVCLFRLIALSGMAGARRQRGSNCGEKHIYNYQHVWQSVVKQDGIALTE